MNTSDYTDAYVTDMGTNWSTQTQLTFVANITKTPVRVEGESPLRVIARASWVNGHTVTMYTRVTEHENVQGQLQTEWAGGVFHPCVIGHVTRKRLVDVEPDLLTADDSGNGLTGVRKARVIGADISLCEVHS